MYINTANVMARGMDYPSTVYPAAAENLDCGVQAPSIPFWNQNCNSTQGLGSVLSDITSGDFSALPGDFITGLNPSTFDIGSYLILGLGLYLLMGKGLGSSKSASRKASRKARLTGAIAQDQALLKAS